MSSFKGSHAKKGAERPHPAASKGSHANRVQEKRQRMILVGAAVAVLAVAAAVWAALALRGKTPAAASVQSQSGAGSSQAASAPASSEEASSGSVAASGQSGASSGQAQSQAGTPRPTQRPASDVTVPVDPAALTLPYAIPGCSLQVEQLFSYDGIFVEDGSDTDAAGIAAVLLKNTGSTAVEYAEVTVTCGGRDLLFKASAVPAGAEIVVMEAGQAAYAEGTVTAASAVVAERDTLEMSQTQVQVTDNGDNSLTVSNISTQDLAIVRLFYKYYMEEGVYVGGIAYTAKLDGLKAGESVQVTPSHYASGYSRVVMVRVE